MTRLGERFANLANIALDRKILAKASIKTCEGQVWRPASTPAVTDRRPRQAAEGLRQVGAGMERGLSHGSALRGGGDAGV